MQLSLQTFQQLLQRMSASVQSSTSQLVDLSVGSILRSILEANASIGLWFQWLIVQTLRMTRAATSNGSDLDSWMADFMLLRQPATPARGLATFSRLLTTLPLTIPVGTVVKTASGGIPFLVDTDTTSATWNASINGYIVPAGISSVDLPIVAQNAGSFGNVIAGAITVVATAVPGLDFVSNASALSGGADAESDNRFRERFQAYINSRSRATADAVAYALTSLQQSIRFVQFENTDTSGAFLPGHFLVVVDDGSGQPSAALLSNAYAAIDNVRPIGSIFSVQPPIVVPVSIAISLAPGGAPLSSGTLTQVAQAVTNYVGRLSIGPTLSMTRIVEIAYRAGQFSNNIESVTMNGTASDLTCPKTGVLIVQSVTVQ